MTIVSGNRQTGRAGEALAENLCIKVVDVDNNPIKNHPVRLQATTESDGHFASGAQDTTVITGADGIACVTWILGCTLLPDSQSVTVSANDGIQDLQGSPVTFVAYARAGAPSATASSIEATGPVPANGRDPSTITVTVQDQCGNPIAGVPVVIIVFSGEDSTALSSIVTNLAGKAVTSFTSTTAGLKRITARVAGTYEITPGTTVRFTPLAPTQLSSIGGNAQTGNVNTVLAEPICVKVGDEFDNGVPGVTVEFSVDNGDGRILGQSAVLSDSNGLACLNYVLGSTVVENRIRASSRGLKNSPIIFVANAVNSPAANLILKSGNNQTGVVLEDLPKPIIVRVTDDDDRPVYGTPVRFDVSFGGGKVNGGESSVVQSDEFGEVKVKWSLGPNAGLNTIRVTANGLSGSPITLQAAAQTGRPTDLVASSGNGASGPVDSELPTPLIAQVTDASGNGVDGVPVIFELIKGSGQLSENLVASSNGGFAAAKITFGQESGERVVRVSSHGLSGSPILYRVYAVAQRAVAMRAIPRTNNQIGTAGLPLNFPLQVRAVDEYDNPIAGVQISFVIKTGGGSFSGQPAATKVTNDAGIAGVEWTVGPGQNAVEAISTGLTGSPIEFVAGCCSASKRSIRLKRC